MFIDKNQGVDATKWVLKKKLSIDNRSILAISHIWVVNTLHNNRLNN